MIKKTVSILTLLSFAFSLLPITGAFALPAASTTLSEVVSRARPLLFNDNSEQTEKYLYDRYQRATAVCADDCSEEVRNAAACDLQNAIDLLVPMKGSERVSLSSFDSLTTDDIAAIFGLEAENATLDNVNKPAAAVQSVAITSQGFSSYSNRSADGIIGLSPFFGNESDTDGFRIWIDVNKPSKLDFTVGAGEARAYTVFDIPVDKSGYLTVPYYFFRDRDGNEPEDPLLLDVISLYCEGATVFRFADLHAYREIVDKPNPVDYSEERITQRAGIVDNAYYKIYEDTSFASGSPKAVTLGPIPDETTLLWQGAIDIPSDMSFTLEPAERGLLTQLWQLTPDPERPSYLRLINKASACAAEIAAGDGSPTLKYGKLDYNNANQKFSFSLTGGKFKIEVSGVGKLTVSGGKLRATKSSKCTKFVLVKVNDGEYKYSWGDEFDGDALDRKIWMPDNGFFFGGGNSSIFVDSDEVISVKDGKLLLKALCGDNNGYQSTANQLKTNGKYAVGYGRVEVRAKMPKGIGMWPAIWMMPVDSMNMARSEIDLMEMPVRPEDAMEQEKLYSRHIGTFHWADKSGKSWWNKPVYLYAENYKSFSEDYHTYAVEIDAHQVRMYLDGALYNTLNLCDDGLKFAYGDVPRYLILSSGGILGDGHCVLYPECDYNDLELSVDYVRAFSRAEEATDDVPDMKTPYSVSLPDSVEYTGKTHNYYMYNFPMAVSPDGNQAVMADQAGFLCVYNPKTNKLLDVVSTGKYQAFLSVKYSPDGSRVAAATMTGSILVFDTADYSLPPVKIHNGCTMHYCLDFTKDGEHIIAGGFNGGAQALKNPINNSVTEPDYFRVFNVETGGLENEIYLGSTPLSFALSPNGEKLAVTTTSAGIFVYDTANICGPTASDTCVNFKTEHKSTINHCAFSPDGATLASSDIEGNVVIWDVAAKTALSRLDTVGGGSVRKFSYSHDGKHIVTTCNDTAARVYDVESGRCVSLLGGFKGIIHDAAYSPDDRYIVVASLDHTMKLYDASGAYLSTLLQGDGLYSEGHISSDICFTPDSRYVLCTDISFPRTINKWQLSESTDKSSLKAAIALYKTADSALSEAKKVYSLKYATQRMIDFCTAKLTGTELPQPVKSAKISSDGESFGRSATALSDGWAYISADISRAAGDVSLVIKKNGVEDVVITAKTIRKACEPVSDGYNSWLMRTCLAESGEYTITLVEDCSGEASDALNLSVGEVSTTRLFKYTVTPQQTVTINSCKMGIEDVYIPDFIDGYPVTAIADYAFSYYGLSVRHMTLRLPSTLKTIGAYAFNECSPLKELALPEGLESVGEYAFAKCHLLQSIEIPDSVTYIGKNAFYYDRGTNFIKLGSGMEKAPADVFRTTIGNRAFIFSEGIKTIPKNVSNEAHLCEKIYIPLSAESIDPQAINATRYQVKVYGYVGSVAEEYAATNTRFEFVPLAAPVISGVENGAEYDLFDGAVSASWDDGHVAYLNGEIYKQGTPITETGSYTLKVMNGYDEFSTEVSFTIKDTTPMLGDVDGDECITVSDVLRIMRMAAGITTYNDRQLVAADIDKDGVPSISDAMIALRASVGITTIF